jgi:hypothetical protein
LANEWINAQWMLMNSLKILFGKKKSVIDQQITFSYIKNKINHSKKTKKNIKNI